MVRIHFVIEMIWWTGLAPWEFEFPFPGSLTSTFHLPPASRANPPFPPTFPSTACPDVTPQFENNYFTEMCSGSEAGSYLRLIDFCITQL